MSTTTFECPPCCGEFVEIGCCDNDLPNVLAGTITHNGDDTGDCSNWDGATGTLTYNAGLDRWIGVIDPGCGEVLEVEFYCDDEGGVGATCDDFKIDWEVVDTCTAPSGGTSSPNPTPPCQCDPLDVDFGIGFDAAGCDCCADSTTNTQLTLKVTE